MLLCWLGLNNEGSFEGRTSHDTSANNQSQAPETHLGECYNVSLGFVYDDYLA
jgi:hypothetical protein